MPDPEAAPYPPMPVLRGAVPGWPPGDPLTSVNTSDAARRTLQAESETSVLDPVGLRRLWMRDVHVLLLLVVVLAMVGFTVQYVRGDDQQLPLWWLVLMPLVIVTDTSGSLLSAAVYRALPAEGVVPRSWPARWRWHRQQRREPVVVPPPAAWPAGSEAYAVLSGAASVESVAPAWLSERVGLSAPVGSQWVAALWQQGWLIGGGHALGLPRLPERHVQVTAAGRERLDRERARLRALASG